MTTEGTPGVALAPRNASALVVGLERYEGFPGAGSDLPGSAQLAARFAVWLLENRICRPERITLMTAFDQAAYDSEAHDAALSPTGMFSKLKGFDEGAGKRVKMIPQARAEEDFKDWINGDQAPRSQDQLFVLFWVGHGFTYPYRRDYRLCLLGTDAEDYQLKHVELTNLLDTVAEIAPGAHEVTFLNTCRAPVRNDWERRLEEGYRAVSRPVGGESGHRRSRRATHAWARQSVVYAAAAGQTTKMAGWQDRNFAEVLLDRLDGLPRGENPAAVFGASLQEIGDQLRWGEGFRPRVTTFGYFHDRDERLDTPPPTDDDLTHEEWTRLTEIAGEVDTAAAKRPSPYLNLYWNAYYYAIALGQVVGVDDPADLPPERLDTLDDLIRELCDRPCRSNWVAPPLVIACDFVANVPRRRRLRKLDAWCQDWASSRRRRGGPDRLGRAQGKRPASLHMGEYLSISVDDAPESLDKLPRKRPIPSKQYWLKGFLWAAGGPALLEGDHWVTEGEIAKATADLIGQAAALRHSQDKAKLLVELVLPRDLLGRRLEYEGESELGFMYPVVFRDLERLRRRWKVPARDTARAKQDRIEGYKPKESSPWSAKIRWIPCAEISSLTKTDISAIVTASDTFAIAIEHGSEMALSADDEFITPKELIYSVDAGAAIVVSMHPENYCDRCTFGSPPDADGNGTSCLVSAAKQLIHRNVDDRKLWKGGLRDLPFILHAIRPDLYRENQETGERIGLKIGVLMEDRKRLMPGYLKLESGAREMNSSAVTGGIGR